MNDPRTSLTPQERREFERIQAQLAQEMPDAEHDDDHDDTARLRLRRRLTVAAVVVGIGLLVAGLVVTIVLLAFVGFVVLLVGLWWASSRLDVGRWVAWARSSVTPVSGRGGEDRPSGPP